MTKSQILIFVVLATSLVLSGCIQTSSEPEIVRTRVVRATPVSNVPSTPPQAFDFQTGAELYAENCAPCHGAEGLGDGEAAAGFDCEMPQFANYSSDVDLQEWFLTAQNGKRSSETCIMPPWNQRMNTDQIWHTVAYAASLRYDQGLSERGETVLASYQEGEANYLNNTAWQVERTDSELLAALQTNELEGFDIPQALSEEEQRAALVYLRSQAFTGEPEVAQAQEETPEPPVATEEAIPETEDTRGLDSLLEPPPVSETYTLTGQLINGTEGASIPQEQTLRLRVVGLGEDGSPQDIHTTNTTTAPDGSFVFENVPYSEQTIAAIQTEYAGVRQTSPQIFPEMVDNGEAAVEFTIYETTAEEPDITLRYVESLIDAVTAENASLIFQNFEFSNNSDRIYVGGEDGRTLAIPAPSNAVNVQIEAIANAENRFQREQQGQQVIYYDTAPVYPGGLTRIGMRYDVPYNGSMTISMSYPYPVEELGVYVSNTRGLELESDQLTPIEPGQVNNITYNGFGLRESPLPSDTTLSYRVYDGERAASAAAAAQQPQSTNADSDESFLEENTTLILGLGILLLLAGGMFLAYDLMKQRIASNSTSGASLDSREALLEAITELESDFEAGRIDEATYNSQRQALKEALKRYMT